MAEVFPTGESTPEGKLTIQQAVALLKVLHRDFLDVDADSVELALEMRSDVDEQFKTLGRVGAQLWLSQNPDADLRARVLSILEEVMPNYIGSTVDIHEDQSAVFMDFNDRQISDLYDIFDILKVHYDGIVAMQSSFYVQNMMFNMNLVVQGMIEYFRSAD